jgi:hypothetical protein
MPTLNSSVPTRLSIFVTDPNTGWPVARLPLYAEVAVPRIVPVPPINERFRELMGAALFDVDPTATGNVRDRVEAAALHALAETVDEASRDRLITQPERQIELFHLWFKEILDVAHRERMADIPPADLKPLIAAALRRVGPELGLGLLPVVEKLGIVWADPLGVLTTDHVGYASFDLRRLRPEVQLMVAEAIEARRNDPDAVSKLAIWVYPYGYAGRFDALSQARFAFDAVVARLSMTWNTLPPALINMGPRALQNPSLTDWRLSPASFAASPKTLVGEDGCEEMVPANLALQEFLLRQVVRLTSVPTGFNVPSPYKAAYVDDYKVSWFSLGHSLGEILYSLPLAPGETVKLAAIDWSWDSLTKRDETTKLTEEVLHQTHRDRTISETVKAGLKEWQHGSSLMGGTASAVGGSLGANLGVVGLGASVGNTWSLGGSTASSDGSRDLAAENVQRLNDSFSQASSALREINSTVVIQARQEEKESIQTRTFSNYNHSHTLTILYYEVLRHYRVTVEWVRRRPAVLIQVPTRITTFDAATLIGHRFLLEPALLDPTLKPAFDALDKQETIREHQTLHAITTSDTGAPQWWEGDIEFSLFEFGLKTAEGLKDKTDELVMVNLILVDGTTVSRPLLRAWEKGSQTDNINVGERLNDVWMGWFIAKPAVPVKWRHLVGFEFVLHDTDEWRMDRLAINGFHGGGGIPLIENNDVDLWFETNGSSNTFTYIKRPGAPPPLLPPIRTPEKSLTQEERHQINRLTDHFARNKDYYNRVILVATDPNSIAIEFEGKSWTPGQTLADNVDPTPLEVFGSYIAYPLAKQVTQVDDTLVVDLAAALNGNDPTRRQSALGKLAAMTEEQRQEVMERLPLASAKSERLITLPTRGVFAEGKLGHCNVSEEIDNTRFWKWEEHPIPIEAPGINPVTPIQPQPQQVSATPTAFPQSLVNIVNPSPAPDPTGLGAALSLLATPNIFRDMSGRQEVADLLKRLSDNSIDIAEAANKAREIQAKYGADLDKHEKDLALGQFQANAEVARAMIQQRREEAQQVKPNEAQDAIKLSESETRKGNKTPEEHKTYSKQVQENVKGASPKKKPKPNITLQLNLEGYGPRRLIGRFGTTVKQRGNDVGFLKATDYSDLGYLKVGVLNDYDDNRYDVVVEGEVLGGVGINSILKGGRTVVIPRADFDLYDYFYLTAVAITDNFEYETTKSDEITKEVASKLGGSLEGAYKQIITMKVEGGGEWKDGQSHTVATAVKVKVVYYTGGFNIAYNKGE